MNFVFSTKMPKRYSFPTHVNDLIMDRSEATTSEVFVVVLKPGQAPPLHRHEDTEQIFYIVEGEGWLEIGGEAGKGQTTPLRSYNVNASDIVRVPPNTYHRISCVGETPLRYVAVDCFPGGRPTAEPTWESHVRAVCREQGWDFDAVTS